MEMNGMIRKRVQDSITMWYVCLILFISTSRVVSTQPEEKSKIAVSKYQPCNEVCGYTKSSPKLFSIPQQGMLMMDVLECTITPLSENDECRINVTGLLPRRPKGQNETIVHYLKLLCQSPIMIHIVDNVVDDSFQADYAITYSLTHMCDVFWGDLALIGKYTDLRVIFHLEAFDKFHEEMQDPDSIFYESPGLATNTTKQLPKGLRNVGTFGSSSNIRGRFEQFPPIFTKYRWPLMAEVGFVNVSFTEIPEELVETMPSLQAIDIELAPFTTVPYSFPWAANRFHLPRNLSRTVNANQHYSRNYYVEPNLYRRLLWLKHCNITTLPDLAFHGLMDSVILSHCGVVNVSANTFQSLLDIQHIDLSHNEIPVLPKDIFQGLDQLGHVILDFNKIDHLELETFRQLPSLKVLSLKGNALSRIENETFHHLPLLNSLDLSSNKLISVADDFVDTESDKIERIDLSWNHLQLIPSASIYLRNLKVLDLSHNNLTFESFKTLLTAIDISHLGYQHRVDSTYLGPEQLMPAAKRMDLSHNNFKTFRIQDLDKKQLDVFQLLTRFFNIDLKSNPLHCDCHIFPLHQSFIQRDCAHNPDCKFYMDNWLCHSPENLANRSVAAVNASEFRCPVDLADCPESCTCYNRTIDHLLQVDCSNQNLKQLPDSLPDGTKHLILRNANLTVLQVAPDYLSDLSVLDISHNSISGLSSDFVEAISSIHTVHLDHNKLFYIPTSFQSLPLQSQKLHLGSNPIKCDCHSTWVKDWLLSHRSVIQDIDNIVCASGNGQGEILVEVPVKDFVCEALLSATYRNLTISLALLMGLLIIMTFTAYYLRTEIKVLMYKHFKWHPFDRNDEDVTDKMFDGLISYSAKDYKWVCHVLSKYLENSEKGFKLCLHDRDFRVGETIADNIRDAVSKSRRMILVLSRNFLRSDWCMMEFREAHLKVMKEMRKFLILVIYEDIHENELDDELKFYMKNNTYLSIRNKWFWEKLEYAMPEKPIRMLKPDLAPPVQLTYKKDSHPLGIPLIYNNPSYKGQSSPDIIPNEIPDP